MFRKLLVVLSLAIISSLTFAAGNVLYKWKDKEGNTKYGDRPPKDVPFERIKVRQGGSDDNSAAITEKLAPKEQDNSDVEEQLSKAQEQMKQACKIAKTNMQTLSTSKRIKVPAEDGGSRFLTEAEIEEKKKVTQDQIDNYCADANNNSK